MRISWESEKFFESKLCHLHWTLLLVYVMKWTTKYRKIVAIFPCLPSKIVYDSILSSVQLNKRFQNVKWKLKFEYRKYLIENRSYVCCNSKSFIFVLLNSERREKRVWEIEVGHISNFKIYWNFRIWISPNSIFGVSIANANFQI